jgi:histone deacetylase family protein
MIAFDPIYTHPVPQNHRFPMEKYALLYEALLWEGIAEPTDFFTPEPASFEQLI